MQCAQRHQRSVHSHHVTSGTLKREAETRCGVNMSCGDAGQEAEAQATVARWRVEFDWAGRQLPDCRGDGPSSS